MRAICFIQEAQNSDLTLQQQVLLCRRALRKLRWPCVEELYAQAGTEDRPLSMRPGISDLQRAAAAHEADVLLVVDAGHLHCNRRNWKNCFPLCYSTAFILSGAKSGFWIEPGGRHWMTLPGYGIKS